MLNSAVAQVCTSVEMTPRCPRQNVRSGNGASPCIARWSAERPRVCRRWRGPSQHVARGAFETLLGGLRGGAGAWRALGAIRRHRGDAAALRAANSGPSSPRRHAVARTPWLTSANMSPIDVLTLFCSAIVWIFCVVSGWNFRRSWTCSGCTRRTGPQRLSTNGAACWLRSCRTFTSRAFCTGDTLAHIFTHGKISRSSSCH